MRLRSHATRARIGAINAHLTRGTYEQVQNVEVLNELEATTETTFGLERVATGGPRVRIQLPPARSHVRTASTWRTIGRHAVPAGMLSRCITRAPKSRAQPVATPRRTVYFAGSPWQWAGTNLPFA
jgi:hypothetical protein